MHFTGQKKKSNDVIHTVERQSQFCYSTNLQTKIITIPQVIQINKILRCIDNLIPHKIRYCVESPVMAGLRREKRNDSDT